MKNNIIKILIVCIVAGAGGFIWIKSQPLVKYRESNQLEKDQISIDVCLDQGTSTQKAARILDDVWQRLRDVHHRMNNSADDGDLAKINRSYQNSQRVGEDAVALLREAFRYKKITRGVFDVTARSFTDLWIKCQKEDRMPTSQELEDARKATGPSGVSILSDDTVKILNQKAKVDYEGIVAGFAIDEAVKALHKRGIKNFLIDAGGDVYASGVNCSRKPWAIAVRNPNDTSKIIDIIQVSNASVSTVNAFGHFYTIGGQKLSYLINPVTGYPQKDVLGATVVAATALEANILARSLCVLDHEQGVALVNSLGKKRAGIIMARDQEGRTLAYKSGYYRGFQIKRSTR